MGRQAARVSLAERFGARAEERYEKISADELPQGCGGRRDDLGQFVRRPGKRGEPAPPDLVERQ